MRDGRGHGRRQRPRDAEVCAHARLVARGELQYLPGGWREAVLDHGGAHVVKDHGHASAMQKTVTSITTLLNNTGVDYMMIELNRHPTIEDKKALSFEEQMAFLVKNVW